MRKFLVLTSLLFTVGFIAAPLTLKADEAYDLKKKECEQKMKDYPGQYEWDSKTPQCRKIY